MAFKCCECKVRAMEYLSSVKEVRCYRCGATISCEDTPGLYDLLNGESFVFLEDWERDSAMNGYLFINELTESRMQRPQAQGC